MSSNSEAAKLITEAEKCLKTSIFKWKADNDGAASAYSKAAVIFKNSKDLRKCQEMHMKASDCYLNSGGIFHAAQALEKAALLCRELNCPEKIPEMMGKVTNMYLQSNTPDTATLSLSRAAKIMEQINIEEAVLLYQRAFDVAETENKGRQATDALVRATRLLVKNQTYDKAIPSLRTEITYFLKEGVFAKAATATMGLCLVYLIKDGEAIGARNALESSASGFQEEGVPDSFRVVSSLLTAVDHREYQDVVNILEQPLFKHMDNEFAVVARDIKEKYKKKSKAAAEAAAASASSQVEPEEEGDDSDIDIS